MAIFRKVFLFNGAEIEVNINETTYNQNKVVLSYYEHLKLPSDTKLEMTISKEEFIEDFGFLFSHLEGDPLISTKPLRDVLAAICINHIKSFGRLLPLDLETYIVEVILMLDAILSASKKRQPLRLAEIETLTINFRRFIMQNYDAYIP